MSTNPRNKLTYRYDTAPAKDIELYHEAATVRNKIGKNNTTSHELINQLEAYVNGAIIQYDRINDIHGRLVKTMFDRMSLDTFYPKDDSLIPISNPISERAVEKLDLIHMITFLDVHYYLICVDKVRKLSQQFYSAMNKQGVGIEDTYRERVYTKIEELRESERLGRNHLEHIDEKITKREYQSLSVHYDESGHLFTYGTEQRCIHLDVKRVTSLYDALIDMLRNMPDVE